MMSGRGTMNNMGSVEVFSENVNCERRKTDAFKILKKVSKVSDVEAKSCEQPIIEFHSYVYNYISKREGDFFRTGFSIRKASLTSYVISDFTKERFLKSRIRIYENGMSCPYVRIQSDIDLKTLERILTLSFKANNHKYSKNE